MNCCVDEVKAWPPKGAVITGAVLGRLRSTRNATVENTPHCASLNPPVQPRTLK